MNKNLFKIMAVVLLIPASIAQAYAVSVLWGWFIVSTFSLPEVSIPIVLGAILMISMLKNQDTSDIKFNLGLIVKLISAIINPFIYLGIGYIYLQFI